MTPKQKLRFKRSIFSILGLSCIALFACGAVLKNSALLYAAVGLLFGSAFLCAVIAIVVMLRKAHSEVLKESEEEKNGRFDAAAKQEEEIERINTTYRSENDLAQGEHLAKQTIKAFRNADKSEKIKGTVFLVWLLSLIVLGLVFMALYKFGTGFMIAGGCCFGAFVLTIVIAIGVVSIQQKRSLSEDTTQPLRLAKVVSCVLSSETSVGGRTATRVANVTYKVCVDVRGEQKTGYSPLCYTAGDELVVRESKHAGLVTIIGLRSDFGDLLDEEEPSEEGQEPPIEGFTAHKTATVIACKKLAAELFALTVETEGNEYRCFALKPYNIDEQVTVRLTKGAGKRTAILITGEEVFDKNEEIKTGNL